MSRRVDLEFPLTGERYLDIDTSTISESGNDITFEHRGRIVTARQPYKRRRRKEDR